MKYGSPQHVRLINCEVERFKGKSNDEFIAKKAMDEEFDEAYESLTRAGISLTC